MECQLLFVRLLFNDSQSHVDAARANAPYYERTVRTTELVEVWRLLAEDEAMGVKFAVAELDLQIAEPLVVEVPTRPWSACITSLSAPISLLRTLLIVTVLRSLVHFWQNRGGVYGLDGCRFADCRFVGHLRRGW
jgi:hypothetical protein